MTTSSPGSAAPSVEPTLARVERRAVARPKFRATPKRSRTTRVLAVALTAAVALGGGAFALRPLPVSVTPVARGTALDAVYATGTVEPLDRVVVKARAAGPIDLKVREGDRVKKGDLLATIDAPTLRHELARGQANLWAASRHASKNGPQLAMLRAQARALGADLNTVRNDRARLTTLVAAGSSPQAELDRLTDREAALEAQLAANLAQQDALAIDLTARERGSSAEVDSLAARLSDTEVRAPMDGVVLVRFVEPGEVAMINSPLVKIGGADDLILECAIDEADIGRVTLGKKAAVSLYAFPNDVYRGEVFEILPDADREKKTFLTKVKLDAPPAGLRSGMTAEVNVVIDERQNALLIPADAVDANGGVLVVAGGRAQRRTPKLGVHDMLRVEVLGGLSDADEVVVAASGPLNEIDDGARVRATVRPANVTAERPTTARAGMSL